MLRGSQLMGYRFTDLAGISVTDYRSTVPLGVDGLSGGAFWQDFPEQHQRRQDARFASTELCAAEAEHLGPGPQSRIHYREVDIEEVSVRFIDSTAIVLTKLQLGPLSAERVVKTTTYLQA
jgi:hypothetical protein